VLGNFGHLTNIDVKESKAFLLRVRKSVQRNKRSARLRVLDCGAGVGRTAEQLLAPLFDKVDLVEQDERFIAAARKRVPSRVAGKFYCTSLQQFEPTLAYSVIWIQWVLNYLTDDDLVAFFKRVAASLVTDGVLIVKENMLVKPDDDYKFDPGNKKKTVGNIDSHSSYLFALLCLLVGVLLFFATEDSSVTRTDKHFERLFRLAGLKIVDRDQQKVFPKGMLPVIMYALTVEAGDEKNGNDNNDDDDDDDHADSQQQSSVTNNE
jgi:protein N-terminal methyltransferase